MHCALERSLRAQLGLMPALYILFLLLPIYWLVNMSFKTNEEIISIFSLWPQDLTLPTTW